MHFAISDSMLDGLAQRPNNRIIRARETIQRPYCEISYYRVGKAMHARSMVTTAPRADYYGIGTYAGKCIGCEQNLCIGGAWEPVLDTRGTADCDEVINAHCGICYACIDACEQALHDPIEPWEAPED